MSKPLDERTRRLVLAGIIVVFLLTVTTFGMRVRTLVQHGELFWTSGLEGTQIYNIWKVQHGHPLYEVATRPPYVITLYNYLFYEAYAWPLAVLGIVDAKTLVGGRLMTAGFALVGAIFTSLLIRRLVAIPGAMTTTMAVLLALVLWFGSGATGWWVMTLRPDMAAVALATAGLWFYVSGQSSGRIGMTLLAGCAFYGAWGFKQSALLTWIGVIVHALTVRQWRTALALASPVVLFTAATVALQTPSYRFSVFVAPGLDEFSPARGAQRLVLFTLLNLLFLVPSILPLLIGPWKFAVSEYRRAGALLAAGAVGLLVGSVGMAKAGGATNYLFEGYFALGTLGCVLLLRWLYVWKRPSTPALFLVALAIVATGLFPVAQLAFQDWFARYKGGAHGLSWGQAAYESRRTVANALQPLPKPIFTRDDIFAQPWHASGNGYPSFVVDGVFYRGAERAGLLTGGGLEALIEQRMFQALVLDKTDGLVTVAGRAGYVLRSWPGVVPVGGLVLLTRNGP